jgi:RNA polymerase sigma-70 factor (ECF subfamily)
VRQLVADKLLVKVGGSGIRLLEYSGRGPLESWLRIVALRTAYDLHGKDERRRRLLHKRTVSIPAADAELEIIKSHYRVEFERALRFAVDSLPAQVRALLKLRYLDGLGVGDLAKLHGVDRRTVTRWLVSAKETVRSETRRHLGEVLHISPSDCESLVGVLYSRVGLTLHSLFEAE